MFFLSSCKDDFYEENTPKWLGESIYDELQRRGNFTYFLRIIDENGYDEVLKRTGSKTLFVYDDEAFERFFGSPNIWGVSKFEELSSAQKTLLMNSSMINNAYLIDMLSSTEGPSKGQALRHETAVSVFDSICFEKENIPNQKYWDPYREKGLFLLKDKTPFTMLHFLPVQMNVMGITAEDFSFITNGRQWTSGTAYIYDRQVIEKDITCKNGYIHILDEVLLPVDNMAETIRTQPETSVFNNLLEAFSFPYYDEAMTRAYRENPKYYGSNDSIFVKRFFSKRNAYGVEFSTTPDNAETGVLAYDPGWNSYSAIGMTNLLQQDMAVMFVPSDEHLNEYFNSGGGKFLKDEFGSWDNVPTVVLADLINNHMKPSFRAAIPSNFDKILDDAKEVMGVEKGDVIKSYIANNGVIYITNTVYAPASYSSVMAPTFVKNNMRAIYYGIKDLQYDAYLLAMDAYYSFIVPTDEIFYYIDPVSLKKAQPEVFKFRYDPSANFKTKATAYKYDTQTGKIGDSIRVVSDTEVRNRLEDILEYNIIVGNIEDGKTFYLTKGGGTIKVSGNGEGMFIYGGGEIEDGKKATVEKIYDQTKETNGRGNGKTYIVDKPLQTPAKSVYSILSTTPEFNEFYNLVIGNDQWNTEEEKLYAIFKSGGHDYNVSFMNRYHYTIYVPTNEKIREAIDNGLPTWDIINALPDDAVEEREQLTVKLLNFLRYHFQDNSVFIGGTPLPGQVYETATLNSLNNRFYTLTVYADADNLVLRTVRGGTATVLKNTGTNGEDLYNIMARNFEFNNSDIQRATAIESSAYAVIHQIDNVLYCE